MFTDELIQALPKTDLHVHLDGSLREQTLIELARERNVALPSQTVEGLNALVFKPTYASLPEYLKGFAYTCAVLQDTEALERTAYELAIDNIEEGVRYIEVRFAPQLHMHAGLRFDDVLMAVDRGLRTAQTEHQQSAAVQEHDEPPFRYGIIVCALRYFNEQFSAWYAQLCSLFEGSPADEVLVGISQSWPEQPLTAEIISRCPSLGLTWQDKKMGFQPKTMNAPMIMRSITF